MLYMDLQVDPLGAVLPFFGSAMGGSKRMGILRGFRVCWVVFQGF